ncbi:MAG: hypothetical protein HRT68_08215 [Flavobacteriaceae bacterium]|nr:hypothetical protein [Flavobacteriaceae bacterium]
MKKLSKCIGIVVCLLLSVNSLEAQKLKSFGADTGKKKVMGKEVRVPYTDVVSYYGFIKPGSEPDEVKDNKKYYYLYVWIPVAAPELGVRMVSPAPSNAKTKDGDVVAEEYTENKSDTKSYFDTWISLEKAEGITSIDQAVSDGGSATWNKIKHNDDSSEMPKQPSGKKYNSLMRVKSEVSNPLKSITMGLYRIGFTTYKKGEVEGSFMAQVGSPVKLPGVKISNKLENLKGE